jgi:DNA-directed RNA polymerase subunit omega
MIQPSLDSLVKKVDSKYTLVVAASKRARQIVENNSNTNSKKPVTAALEEIDVGLITYQRTKSGIK